MNSELCFIPLSFGAKLEFQDMAIGLLYITYNVDRYTVQTYTGIVITLKFQFSRWKI